MEQPFEDRVRARAHALWEAEGRPEGRAEAHWSQALAEEAGGRPAGTEEAGEEAGAEGHGVIDAPTPGRASRPPEETEAPGTIVAPASAHPQAAEADPPPPGPRDVGDAPAPDRSGAAETAERGAIDAPAPG